MAKGLDKHRERQDALGRLGRSLARRSSSHCELCEASGVALGAYEVAPLSETPELERTLFACEICTTQLADSRRIDISHWRCLEHSVWSEVPAVQVVAVRMLRQLCHRRDCPHWLRELNDTLHVSPEVEEWLDS